MDSFGAQFGAMSGEGLQLGFGNSGLHGLGGGCGGPSSVATLQPHPFNVLISDFQQRRQNPAQKKEAGVEEFLGAFKKQIHDLDHQYFQQKKQIRD